MVQDGTPPRLIHGSSRKKLYSSQAVPGWDLPSLGLCDKGCRVVLTFGAIRHCVDGRSTMEGEGARRFNFVCDLLSRSHDPEVVRKIRKRFIGWSGRKSRFDLWPGTSAKRDPFCAWDENLSAIRQGRPTCYPLPLRTKCGASGGGDLHIFRLDQRQRGSSYRGFAPYYVSKTAVKAVVEALALELCSDILVTASRRVPFCLRPLCRWKEYQAVIRSTAPASLGGAE